HRGVVDHLDRQAERLAEIETLPALSQVVWILRDLAAPHDARVTNRDCLAVPAVGDLANLLHHVTRTKPGARIEFDLGPPTHAELHWRASDIDHQDAPRDGQRAAPPPRRRAGNIMSARSSENTPSTAIPNRRNGSDSSQMSGQSSRATIASGQQTTSSRSH